MSENILYFPAGLSDSTLFFLVSTFGVIVAIFTSALWSHFFRLFYKEIKLQVFFLFAFIPVFSIWFFTWVLIMFTEFGREKMQWADNKTTAILYLILAPLISLLFYVYLKRKKE